MAARYAPRILKDRKAFRHFSFAGKPSFEKSPHPGIPRNGKAPEQEGSGTGRFWDGKAPETGDHRPARAGLITGLRFKKGYLIL